MSAVPHKTADTPTLSADASFRPCSREPMGALTLYFGLLLLLHSSRLCRLFLPSSSRFPSVRRLLYLIRGSSPFADCGCSRSTST